eukprot:GHVL01024545.1.p1 GENE.GHVL01024545.1~~GHVL01024545.1.p1  ORF type:complete len:150 (+),score=21.72 GHVL01024545.1:1443-1892(+)
METKHDSEGHLLGVEKVMDLRTTTGVKSVCFSADNTKAVVATKDDELMLWNIDVRYRVGEDPKAINCYTETDADFNTFSIIGLTDDNHYLIAACLCNIRIYKMPNFEAVDSIFGAHESPITSLSISSTNGYVVTGAPDHRPRLWKLPKE